LNLYTATCSLLAYGVTALNLQAIEEIAGGAPADYTNFA